MSLLSITHEGLKHVEVHYPVYLPSHYRHNPRVVTEELVHRVAILQIPTDHAYDSGIITK